MSQANILTEYMSWPEYEAQLQAGRPVFLPVGAHEQHGPHLPMATDAIFAQSIAETVAREIGGIVLPTLRYGYKSQGRSGGGQSFTGTVSLDGSTLTAMTLDILRELGRHGARHCVIINGHFENQWFLTEAIELAQREFALTGKAMKIVRTEYWDFTPEGVYDEIFEGEFPGVDLEHAALIETSMMLYLHPEHVRMDKIPNDPLAQFPPYDTYPQTGEHVPKTGVLAPAGDASTEKGERLVNCICESMARALKAELATDT